ncbi:hypothetical protein ACWDOP_17700 [Nocardia sp. NPDC003693]
MIVNAHVYVQPGAHAPTLHLRRLPKRDLFEHTTGFEYEGYELNRATSERFTRDKNRLLPLARTICARTEQHPSRNSAIAQGAEGQILMIYRTDNNLYSIPGG